MSRFSLSIASLPCRLTLSDASETEAVGIEVAKLLLQNPCLPTYVALYGDLGVGKTVFVRGFASLVAPGAAVRSPTFSLVNEYRSADGGKPVFHFDMYRIQNEDDLYSIGYDDYPERGYCLVEWSENIPFALPRQYLRVTIEKVPAVQNTLRRLTVEIVPNLIFSQGEAQ